ncbi:histidine transporter permease [Salmonella enterica subsp. enterica serovar Typhimurium]|nr:histidine transporter permease [Salmonella enterica subsp. enterica serovar Typhimurium]
MLLIFYGLQIALNVVTDSLGIDQIDIDPMVAGIITLGFIYGAYFTETFRGAFMAVPKGHIEAATAFGFTHGANLPADYVPGDDALRPGRGSAITGR